MKIDRAKIYADVPDLLSDEDIQPDAFRQKLISLKIIIRGVSNFSAKSL